MMPFLDGGKIASKVTNCARRISRRGGKHISNRESGRSLLVRNT